MKHKNAEIIKAKADDMSLVVFAKSLKWHEVDADDFQFFNKHEEYFLCLPQHKEVVIRSLNGEVAEFESVDEIGSHALERAYWRSNDWYMDVNYKSRIIPKKEKRWIAATRFNCVDKLFDKKSQAEEFVTAFYPNNKTSDFQFIEIEVEI